jgi:hypothetical protein
MQDSQFLRILFAIRLNALGHKVLRENLRDLVGVLLLI